MDQRLVEIEVDRFEVALFGEFDVFAGVGDLEGGCLSQHLHALVEVLSVLFHQVGGLVVLEAAGQVALVVGQSLAALAPLFVNNLGILPGSLSLDGGQSEQRLLLIPIMRKSTMEVVVAAGCTAHV